MTTPYEWRVGPTTRSTAQVISRRVGPVGNIPGFQGTPSDRSVYEAVVYLKSRGLAVTLCPRILMDIPFGNGLPNPYGGGQQPVYPHRSQITVYPAYGQPGTAENTIVAARQILQFTGAGAFNASQFGWDDTDKTVSYTGPADNWSYCRFILHLARIAAESDANGILIGSEMMGLTHIRSNVSTFPFVTDLVQLLSQVRIIVGSSREISYSASWREYHTVFFPGTADQLRYPLDFLWGNSEINYVGISNYAPLSDWRAGFDHLDAEKGFRSVYDTDYLRYNVSSGEYFDFLYDDIAARNNQIRTPIVDPVESLDSAWEFRLKDFRSWWGNSHSSRDGNRRVSIPASIWSPRSKRIAFTEVGCPSISHGSNEPDARSDFPYYSFRTRDDHMQRAYLEAVLTYWRDNDPDDMILADRCSVWEWDARPYPDFPEREDVYYDAPQWDKGYQLNGRLQVPEDPIGIQNPFRYTTAVRPVVHNGNTYEPLPVSSGRIRTEGTLERGTFQINLPRTSALSSLFRNFRLPHPMTLTILQGHLTDTTGVFYPIWTGRIISTRRRGEETEITGAPSAVALARSGLTRNYQIGCPHKLYGPMCKADKARATTVTSAQGATGSTLNLVANWTTRIARDDFITGLVEWENAAGLIERRRILNIEHNTLTLSGPADGLSNGDRVSVLLGCAHTVEDCVRVHDNIENCGACPTIPNVNPLSFSTNNFY